MAGPVWENLAEFFDPSEFATAATITRDGQEIGEVFGIFDDPTQIAELGEYQHHHATPRFVCAEDDATDVLRDDVLTIEGKSFDVLEEPQLDGTGIATVVLSKPNVMYNAGI